MKLYGGIEAGGTKFNCMVAASPDQIIAETRIPTTTPEETIRRTNDFFSPFALKGDLAAVGIGSFGPVDLNHNSSTYGFITTTPKPNWSFTDLLGGVRKALQIPVAFDTDVNVAAFGIMLLDAGKQGPRPVLVRNHWYRDRRRRDCQWQTCARIGAYRR